MNYSDVPTRSRTTYLKLKDTQDFDCDQKCLCRNNSERSTKDILYRKWFLENQTPSFPPLVEGYTKPVKEGYKQCICSSRQGGCGETCQDVEKVEDAYVSGRATEFSNFKSPGWNRGPEIGSYRFPKSCGGAPYPQHPNFGPWDFTEFGN